MSNFHFHIRKEEGVETQVEDDRPQAEESGLGQVLPSSRSEGTTGEPCGHLDVGLSASREPKQ